MGILDMVRRYQATGTRKFYAIIHDEHIQDPNHEPIALTSNKDYFRIRLCEMFLKNKTNYISGFIPMTIALNMFDYAGKACTVPVIVGNQMLSDIEKYIKNEDIEFRNVPIIGPVPYIGDTVSLFIGLYRIAVDDLARSLFNVIDNLIGSFDLCNLSTYLNIADRIGNGLTGLIGLSQVDMRLGTMDTFGDPVNRMRDQYLLFINCPEDKIDIEKLWIKNGRLFEGDNIDKANAFSRHDYVLVHIERLENRSDITTLPFHQLFLHSKTRIWEGDLNEAERLFLNLMRDITISPDLTTEDRSLIMETYLANYQQEKENYASIAGKTQSASIRSADRSYARASTISAVASVQKAAGMAEQITEPARTKQELFSVQHRLYKLAQHWNEIPFLEKRNEPVDLSDSMLSRQLKAIRTNLQGTAAAPEALADILNFSAFHNI